jgi:hypothetical protein
MVCSNKSSQLILLLLNHLRKGKTNDILNGRSYANIWTHIPTQNNVMIYCNACKDDLLDSNYI